ncbi:MAG: DUF1726 domain-containing protein, partial [Robiginitomaculum sp.]|nr:DUF1726 domain-containing protein [Robiginitomaculum sp.]
MTTEFRLELAALKSLSDFSRSHFCRLPILIIGEQADRNQLAAKFLATYHQEDITWISQQTPHVYRKQAKIKAVNVIGHEYRLIVYDIEDDFDPNLFAALSGTLRGGGMFLILCPPLESWLEEKNDHWFMWRFIHKLSKSDLCIKIKLDENEFRIHDTPLKPRTIQPEHQRLEQQNLAVQQIIHVVRGHRNRPLVLLADRGRGKSAALGIAASKLLMGGLTNVFITA